MPIPVMTDDMIKLFILGMHCSPLRYANIAYSVTDIPLHALYAWASGSNPPSSGLSMANLRVRVAI